MSIRNLNHLFHPAAVALIGASRRPQSVGATIAQNLLSAGLEGPVMMVHPSADEIAGVQAYRDVASLPRSPDLAVICTPPDTIPDIITALGERGTKAAIVISAGFAELGTAGLALQDRILQAARPHLLRVLGPNCVGLMVPGHGLNASFAHRHPRPGHIAFLSQSGAIITSVLDWATARGIGFSHMVSLGGMADVDFGDLLDYLARDPQTDSILLYVENVTAARKFMSAARAASRVKPVIVVKAGRHAEAAKAAASHTGALAGADDVYTAAFRRAGMLRVGSLEELFDAVATLATRPRIRGDRMAIISNGGGLGVLATDQLLDDGGRLADLAPETLDALNAVLPRTWSHNNPVDLIGDAPGERYADAMTAVLNDPGVDTILVLNCPVAVADSVDAARATATAAATSRVPVFTSWLGEDSAVEARTLFRDHGIPTYPTPDQAVRGFMHIVRFERNQTLLMETPPPSVSVPEAGRKAAKALVAQALAEEREILTEPESKALLQHYGIPTVDTRIASSVEQAVDHADAIGYPVALKILSPDITHKTDVGGVALSLKDADAVRAAAGTMRARARDYNPMARLDGFTVQPMAERPGAIELIAGLTVDDTFGPVVLFGHGGTAVEVLDDKAMGLPPLNATLARDLITRTRVFRLLKGYRDKAAADLDAIATTIMRLGELAADLPELRELDINPLWADRHGVLALDARVRVAPAEASKDMPADGASRFAIAPYPRHLERQISDRDGRSYTLRPIRPEDEPQVVAMIERCDAHDIRMRFFSALKHVPRSLAARLTQIDYDREMAFVALAPDDAAMEGAAPTIQAMVRLNADPDFDRAEYAVLVRSDRKGVGLGFTLMQAIIDHARAIGVKELYGDVQRDNRAMLAMCTELGFTRTAVPGDASLVEVVLPLQA